MAAKQIDFSGFIGASYTSRSLSADGEETINLFPEIVESGKSKSANQMALYRTPGLKAIPIQIVDRLPYTGYVFRGAIQGMYSIQVVTQFLNTPQTTTGVFVVGAPTDVTWYAFLLIQISQQYATQAGIPAGFKAAYIGPIANPGTGNYISFAANDFEILIVANPNGYIYNCISQAFAAISADGYNGGVTATCVDGYFVVNNPDSNSFSVSAFNDGLTWSGLDQESTQDYPDILSAVANYDHYLQLFGARRSECYYDTGSNSALFARYEGSYQYQGIVAPWSVAFQDNSPFYLGQNEAGQGVVFRLTQFTPTRVSNMAMESQIQDYQSLTDAFGTSYQAGGHMFYVLHFPSAFNNPNYVNDNTQPQFLGVTWVYDVTASAQAQMAMWHKRLSWNPNTGQYTAHAGRFYMAFNGLHLVGDFSSPTVYELNMNFTTDAGAPIRWMRAAPHISTQMFRNTYRWMQLDMQTGTGFNADVAAATVQLPGWGTQTYNRPAIGSNPTVTLNWSDDGGFSWSGDLQMTVGRIGRYGHQATVNRLGLARDFTARTFSTDPGVVCLVNAFLGVEAGTN